MSNRGRTGFDLVLDSPVGALGVRMEAGAISAIEFLGEQPIVAPACALGRGVAEAITAYFRDPRSPLDTLPLAWSGSAFQRRVWAALRALAVGQTVSYGQLARELGTSARAVGGACRTNPLALVVPCHRVVGARGPGGFMGAAANGAAIKSWLLNHERGCGRV